MTFGEQYWSERYRCGQTGWDAGAITTPLKEYIDQLTNKDIEILIPGAGNAYEAEYLFKSGCKNVTVPDISIDPLENLKTRVPDWPEEQLVQVNFFEHTGRYDLILEQTFFCALHPSQRPAYAAKMHELLKPGGRLAGVLFNDPLHDDEPPFGGNAEEYKAYFAPYFAFQAFESCYNSIPPRAGRELFINLVKKTLAFGSKISGGRSARRYNFNISVSFLSPLSKNKMPAA